MPAGTDKERPLPVQSHVEPDCRFIAAHDAVNPRIARCRQALAALAPGEAQALLPIELQVPSLPVASTWLAFLNGNTESALFHLRHFLSTLARLDSARLALPKHNTDLRCSQNFNKARRFHGFASAVLVAVGNRPVPRVTAAVAVVCVIALLMTPKLSYRPADAARPFSNQPVHP